mmetsp:Transcript_86790/g.201942  ORF Transcript_86790/g.201942 Transcript_86790/m.201942 type:complete len:873 (+) Transcript_86790:133-2751(+)|eukprot:CAMPEP_0171132828 /NCGR_PEP_ID=MMETSP0766_2-20121228/125212_1 /TAXON_ID=439317 /ORGANISM="Gambierdiscus australes, Strain CAWD 149" /LENGTH=872 /DNA_ID=CAMNT_0011596177 /DNA_START=55 /DNA_END=2673 /DNA_ORIENTATION=+
MVGSSINRGSWKAAAGHGRHSTAKTMGNAQQQHKAINRQITLAAEQGDVVKLLDTAQAHLQAMNGINLATAFHRVAKLAVRGAGDKQMEQVKQMQTFQDLLGAIVGHILGHSLWHQDKTSASEAAGEMPVQCMSIVSWSCATLQIRHKPLLMTIAGITARHLSEFKPYELSNLLWAYAKLSICPPELLTNVTARLLSRNEGEFKVQCLSTIAWSFATLKRRNLVVFTSLASELAAHAVEMKPQEISNTLWAFAKSRCPNTELFHVLGTVAAEESMIWQFKPQELSNTAWAFATVGLQHPALFSQVENVSIRKRHEMVPQNIANILWSFAKLQIHSWSNLFSSLLEVAGASLQHHKPQELSAVIWAAAQHCPGHAGFFGMAIVACTHRLHEFSLNALANLVKAFSVVKLSQPKRFVTLVQESLLQLPHFKAAALCNLLRGAVTATLSSTFCTEVEKIEASITRICEHLTARVSELGSCELLDISATLRMGRCTLYSGKLYEAITHAKLQQHAQHPDTKTFVPNIAHSVGSMSTAPSQADDEESQEDTLWANVDDAANSDGASSTEIFRATDAGKMQNPQLCGSIADSGITSVSAAAQPASPREGGEQPWRLALPAPCLVPVPVSRSHALSPSGTPTGAASVAATFLSTAQNWACATVNGDMEPKQVQLSSFLLQEAVGVHPCRDLSTWLAWRSRTCEDLKPSEAARIVRSVLVQAEALLGQGALALGSVQPDRIFMGENEEPYLHELLAAQPGGWGDALKWLSPEEAAGRSQGGVGAWPALAFRLGLLLHCLGSGTCSDPYPGKSGEAVLVGLLAELDGLGPPVRPDMAAYKGPDILRRLVAACLRMGGQAPPARGAMMAVLDALAAGGLPQA